MSAYQRTEFLPQPNYFDYDAQSEDYHAYSSSSVKQDKMPTWCLVLLVAVGSAAFVAVIACIATGNVGPLIAVVVWLFLVLLVGAVLSG